MAAVHQTDLVMCRKLPGVAVGKLCEQCEGKCVICDSYVRPCRLVRVCDECNYGVKEAKCIVCNRKGVSDAFYCQACVQQEKHTDGCPKIINLGASKAGYFYENQKYKR